MRHWRANLILLLLFGVGAIIAGRLVFLQVLNEGFYKAFAQGQQNMTTFSKGERGSIFVQDKNDNRYTLAANLTIPFVFVSPAEIQENSAEIVQQLTETLAIEADDIVPKLDKKQSLFEIIKKDITKDEVEQIQKLGISGVHIGQERIRAYPQGAFAAHVAGFTNQDGLGQYGVEEYYNDVLEGKEGLKAGAKNPASYLLNVFAASSKDGEDIVLTLDYNIQSVAESLLSEAEANLSIEGGSVIVLEPSTGRILALANAPTFDPNAYSDTADFEVFQNAAIQKLYEPGSVFKALTMASAIEEKAVTPQTGYEDKGFMQIGGRKITNYDQRIWGYRTMTEVLEYSINTGVVFAERRLGHDTFLDYMRKLELFSPTNIDLEGEIASKNTEFQKGYEINFATAAFGQGIEMTPLQLVKAFAALANGGTMVQPYLVEERRDPKEIRVFSPNTATQITHMLTSVVENGYAKSAQIPGYRVAGKTGTAQVSWSALGVAKSGYSDKTIQSFAGYAPAFDPKFVILVKLDNPAARTAEYSAVPIFRELAKYILDYYQIPPTYPVE